MMNVSHFPTLVLRVGLKYAFLPSRVANPQTPRRGLIPDMKPERGYTMFPYVRPYRWTSLTES